MKSAKEIFAFERDKEYLESLDEIHLGDVGLKGYAENDNCWLYCGWYRGPSGELRFAVYYFTGDVEFLNDKSMAFMVKHAAAKALARKAKVDALLEEKPEMRDHELCEEKDPSEFYASVLLQRIS